MHSTQDFQLAQSRNFFRLLNDTFKVIFQDPKRFFGGLILFALPFFLLQGLASGFEHYHVIQMSVELSKQTKIESLNYMDRIIPWLGQFRRADFFFVAFLSWICDGLLNSLSAHFLKGGTAENIKTIRINAFKSMGMLAITACFINILNYLGLILLIVPAIFFWPIWQLCFTIQVAEGKDFFQSVKRSYQLVKPRWKKSFFFLFILFGLVYSVTLIFQIPTAFLTTAHLRGFQHLQKLPYSIASCLVLSTVQCFIHSVFSVGAGVLYYSLKEEAEPSGWEEKIAGIGGE